MCCYFLHQETYALFEKECKQYEAELEDERKEHEMANHNLSEQQENLWREIEVSCVHA
jgi:hypothetical protein